MHARSSKRPANATDQEPRVQRAAPQPGTAAGAMRPAQSPTEAESLLQLQASLGNSGMNRVIDREAATSAPAAGDQIAVQRAGYEDYGGWSPNDQLAHEMAQYTIRERGGKSRQGGGRGKDRDDDGGGRRSSRLKSKVKDNGVTTPILNVSSQYGGDTVQDWEDENSICFHQNATLTTPSADGKAKNAYILRQQVTDSYVEHWVDRASGRIKKRTARRNWQQDGPFKPSYDDVNIHVEDDSITFADTPGWSSGAVIGEEQWISEYQVSFRWTVQRVGSKKVWQSETVTYRATSEFNKDEAAEGEWRARVVATGGGTHTELVEGLD